MKIGINVFGVDKDGRSGLGTYFISLLKNFPEICKHDIEIFGSKSDRYIFNKGFSYKYHSLKIREGSNVAKLWNIISLPGFVKKQKYDVVFYNVSANVTPFVGNAKGVAIVQDIISFTLKNMDNVFQKNSLIASLNNATRIIATSQYIKKDLASLGIDKEKIDVIHNGLDHSYFYPHTEFEDDVVLINPFSIRRPFFIYASRLSCPEKKHIELIKAFSLFKEKTGAPHRLVLAGSENRYAKEVLKAVEKSAYSSDIFITDYFEHDNLPELYSCADACIFPSVIDGSGLSVIEAISTGIPVLCAKAGALPEIAGDSALYFNPDDTEEFACLIQQIIEDKSLRKQLISNGLDRVKLFSWKNTATKTVEVLEKAVEE